MCSLLNISIASQTIRRISPLQDGAPVFDRCLPAIRVFSILFVLYISLFWVRHQLRDGGDWRRGAGGGVAGSQDELMRLYGVSACGCGRIGRGWVCQGES